MQEDILIRELRQEIDKEKPKEVGKMQKVSRDEALTEAEYIFKRRLVENRPKNLTEANQILTDTFKIIYAYLKSLDYDIPPQELIGYFMRER